MFRCLILINTINVRRVLENAEKYKENWKDECKIICENLYVVYVRMSGEILEDWKLWDNTGLMEIRVTCFMFF